MLSLFASPTSQPIGTDTLASHLNLANSNDDQLLLGYIKGAVDFFEKETRRAIMSQTWDYSLDEFPEKIRLPIRDVQSISSVTYTDTDGNSQTLAAANYDFDATGRLEPSYNNYWPSTRAELNAVSVRFVAGYTNIPDGVTQGILMLSAYFYENRENASPVNLYGLPVDIRDFINHQKHTFL